MTPLGHENVRRFDVSVNDASGVSGIECVRDLDSERQHSLDLHWISANAVLQRHAVEILHDDEGLTFMLADLIDRVDVRTVEGRRGPASRRKRSSACWSCASS
jgi:hypothetical protein